MEHLPLKQGNDSINTWSITHFHVKLIDLCSSSLILIVSTLIRSIHSYSSIIINNIHIFLPATCLYSLHEYKQNTFQKHVFIHKQLELKKEMFWRFYRGIMINSLMEIIVNEVWILPHSEWNTELIRMISRCHHTQPPNSVSFTNSVLSSPSALMYYLKASPSIIKPVPPAWKTIWAE